MYAYSSLELKVTNFLKIKAISIKKQLLPIYLDNEYFLY